METYRTLLVAPDTNERLTARRALEEAGEQVVGEAATLSEMEIAFNQTRPEAVLLRSIFSFIGHAGVVSST